MPMIANPTISAIITTHNEGEELARTVESVVSRTSRLREVIIVDDASSDDSCESIAMGLVRVIRNDRRVGVAYSRDRGSREAQGDVLCYLDGHQRVKPRCLDRCARLSVERNAITCPDLRGYRRFGWRLHGADFQLCPTNGYFSAAWRETITLRRVSSVTGLRAPPYLVPRELYPKVAWSQSLRGWGGSEASMAVKAFFAGIPIFHLAGPLARHCFRKEFPYTTTWDGVWRNHAIIARICFDDSTWFRYWLPRVFEPHLSEETRATLESAEVQAEHAESLSKKVRTDRQFWTDLLHLPPPCGI